jgi:isocitrate dehydrogenase (NAD+)
MTKVTLIMGDGIGPEIAEATRRCIDATGAKIQWDIQQAGVDVMATAGTPLPEATLESVKANGIGLKAPITTPVGTGFRSVNVYLRQALDLYACVRPCKSYQGVRSYYKDIDLVIVRENTEDLWLEVSRNVAKSFPDIEFEDRIVDNMCMQLVQKPELYDVIVLPNLYGDILSDLCAGLVGGLGVAPGANIGEKGAIFEATHGSAPKYKGQNKVNPTALILSGALMLRHMNLTKEADALEKAVAEVIAEGKDVTYDMKDDRNDPTAVGTSQMADAIIARIGK